MDISWWLDGVLQTAVGGLGVLINLVRNLMPRFCAKPRTLQCLLYHCTNIFILVGRPIHVLHDTVTRQIAPFLFLCSGIDEKTEAREQHSFCLRFLQAALPVLFSRRMRSVFNCLLTMLLVMETLFIMSTCFETYRCVAPPRAQVWRKKGAQFLGTRSSRAL